MDRKTEERLLKIVAGALRCTIDAHGPITKEWIGSASKRIVKMTVGEFEALTKNEARQ